MNKLVNNLTGIVPEMHLPNYKYCGPFTRLNKGDKGINPLDEACKKHDLFYHENPNSDSSEIKNSDKELQEAAWWRVLSPDASKSEKFWAWIVTNAMKLKTKLGMGMISEQDLNLMLNKALVIMKKNPKLCKKLLLYYENPDHPYKMDHTGGFIQYIPIIASVLYYLVSSGLDIYSTIKEKQFHDHIKEQIRQGEDEAREARVKDIDIHKEKELPYVHYNTTPQNSLFKNRY